MSAEREIPGLSPTRNSRIRELTAEPIGKVAGWLHEQSPWLSPDQVTALGLVGTALGAIWATEQNSKNRGNRLLPLIVLVASSGMDALDGALARVSGQASKHGQILDACSDRIGEAAMGLARMVAALRRGDIVGTVAATLATLTAPLPSWARASAEEQGRVVPETGKKCP